MAVAGLLLFAVPRSQNARVHMSLLLSLHFLQARSGISTIICRAALLRSRNRNRRISVVVSSSTIRTPCSGQSIGTGNGCVNISTSPALSYNTNNLPDIVESLKRQPGEHVYLKTVSWNCPRSCLHEIAPPARRGKCAQELSPTEFVETTALERKLSHI